MRTSSKMLLLASVFAFITMIHYTTRTDDPRVYFVHVVFQNLYLLPIVFSAYWFGLRGGVLAAVLSTCLYVPHVTLQWSGSAVEKADQLGALAVFLLVGLAAGMLSSMEKSERARADRTEERSQRRAIALALTTLERALKARDDYTRQHSERTAQLAAGLARRLGLDEAACEEVWLAALMHDVGKIGVRDDILLKPDMLTDEELGMIKRHPSIAEEILRPIKGIDNVVSVVYAHHENFDGSGYPRGLRGDEIPLGAQILATADTFCALTDDRVYRKHEEISGALREMDKMAGKKLNPAILEEFKKMIGEQSEL